MVVTALQPLQRFGSRSHSFNHQTPHNQRSLRHFRNVSNPASMSKIKSEPSLRDLEPETVSGSVEANPANGPEQVPTSGLFDADSSSPSSPYLLPRNASYSSNSSSFQEDWEAFPPMDRITVFDLLDNFALPRQLEKWQNTLAAQREKVKRQQEKLRTTGVSARDRVVEEWRRRIPTPDEQLEKYRKRMRISVERLGARWNDALAVTLREKVSFIAGVLNIFISGYIVGGLPEYFYYWYTAQISYFMPIRYYTYHKRGYHYFLADLCYFTNALLVLSLWAFPQSKRLFISTYCLANGNNAVAIAMWRNSMVFHSLDKTTRLTTPPLSMIKLIFVKSFHTPHAASHLTLPCPPDRRNCSERAFSCHIRYTNERPDKPGALFPLGDDVMGHCSVCSVAACLSLSDHRETTRKDCSRSTHELHLVKAVLWKESPWAIRAQSPSNAPRTGVYDDTILLRITHHDSLPTVVLV